MFTDFILNNRGHGVGAELEGMTSGLVRYDPGMLRPFIETHPSSPLRNKPCVSVLTGNMIQNQATGKYEPERKKFSIQSLQQRGINSPVWNAGSFLTRDAWIQLDMKIVRAARQRLRAWDDLMAAAPFGGFDGMSRLTIEYQSMSDPGEAIVDMDGLAVGRRDRPIFDIKSVPLPITHSDFWFSEREIAVSRNGGAPLDTAQGEAAGRRVAEMVEKTLIGVETGVTYGTRTTGTNQMTGTSTVYGYTNFPYRTTKIDLNTPTGTNPEAIMTDLLEMIEQMYGNGFFGPFILYTSTGYTRYLNDDYYRSGSTSAVRTLRERIMEVEGIQEIRRLDYLTSGYQLVLVQMTSDVAEAIDGMDITTVQWDTKGGAQKNFKVMCIKVPRMKATYAQTSGILHATTA